MGTYFPENKIVHWLNGNPLFEASCKYYKVTWGNGTTWKNKVEISHQEQMAFNQESSKSQRTNELCARNKIMQLKLYSAPIEFNMTFAIDKKSRIRPFIIKSYYIRDLEGVQACTSF